MPFSIEIVLLFFCKTMRIKSSNASRQSVHCPQQASVASGDTRHLSGLEPLIRNIFKIVNFTRVVYF